MDINDWFRSHVERCLQGIWATDAGDDGAPPAPDLRPDAEGDYGFRSGTAACYVGIDTGAPVVVRVWAVAACEVRRSARLLGELNDINSRTRSAHVLLIGTTVVVEQMIHAAGVGPETLRQAIDAVSAVGNDVGTLIAGVYGGVTPFATTVSLDDEVA